MLGARSDALAPGCDSPHSTQKFAPLNSLAPQLAQNRLAMMSPRGQRPVQDVILDNASSARSQCQVSPYFRTAVAAEGRRRHVRSPLHASNNRTTSAVRKARETIMASVRRPGFVNSIATT